MLKAKALRRLKDYTPTDHVGKRVILLDDFYGRSIRNFRVFGHFDPGSRGEYPPGSMCEATYGFSPSSRT